jgi:hypothetical protein
VVVTVNRGSQFFQASLKNFVSFPPHLAQAHEAQTLARLQGFASAVPRPALLRNLGLTMQESHIMHWLIQEAQQRDCFHFGFQVADCSEACSKHFQ